MIRFSPNITIYDLNQEIEFLNQVIWAFSKNLNGISSKRQRFNIHLVAKKEEERKWLEGNVKSIWILFDQLELSNSDSKYVKKIILKLIRDSFLAVSTDLNWDINKINEAFNKTLIENFEYNYKTKSIFNKSRTKKGSIEIELETDKVILYGIISDKKNSVLVKRLIIETFPHHVDWFKTFSNLKWINDKDFGFEFAKGLTLSISEDEKNTNWKNRNSEEDLGFIRSITYRTFETQKEKIEWANK